MTAVFLPRLGVYSVIYRVSLFQKRGYGSRRGVAEELSSDRLGFTGFYRVFRHNGGSWRSVSEAGRPSNFAGTAGDLETVRSPPSAATTARIAKYFSMSYA